jgi:kynurenine 3-monooxygenase
MTRKETVTIVGAGLVGSLLAIFLARRGYRVTLVERRPDPRSGRVVGGRSINLALSDRGLLALERAGIAAQIEAVAIPMKGRMVHQSAAAPPQLLPYGDESQAIRSVSRGGLNTTLIELAGREPNVTLSFERRCAEVDLKAPAVTLEAPDGRTELLESDLLIGADGAFSAVRYEMLKLDRFDYRQDYLEHGYKELNIPPGPDGTFLLEKNALHIWPRSSFMLIALPNLDGSFTCTLFFALDGANDSFAALQGRGPDADADGARRARAYFERVFPDALALMPTFDEDWRRNPTSSLVTVRCQPWTHAGRTLLIGDAAHAIVPFFGQGMNAGFEDCRVLMEILDETDDDWARALPRYERARKENGDAIALLALENFVEMRDKVADPGFLLQKKIEKHLAGLRPDLVTPKYTLVTFSPHIPYSEALRRGRVQDAVLERAARIPGIGEGLASGQHDAELVRLLEEVAAELRPR